MDLLKSCFGYGFAALIIIGLIRGAIAEGAGVPLAIMAICAAHAIGVDKGRNAR